MSLGQRVPAGPWADTEQDRAQTCLGEGREAGRPEGLAARALPRGLGCRSPGAGHGPSCRSLDTRPLCASASLSCRRGQAPLGRGCSLALGAHQTPPGTPGARESPGDNAALCLHLCLWPLPDQSLEPHLASPPAPPPPAPVSCDLVLGSLFSAPPGLAPPVPLAGLRWPPRGGPRPQGWVVGGCGRRSDRCSHRHQPGLAPRNQHRRLGGRERLRGLRGPQPRPRHPRGLQHGGLPASHDGQPPLLLLQLQRWVPCPAAGLRG